MLEELTNIISFGQVLSIEQSGILVFRNVEFYVIFQITSLGSNSFIFIYCKVNICSGCIGFHT